ncbi:MAG: hypothetical protein ACMUHX_04650 [bacterium]
MRLYEELSQKTYTPSRYVCFVITKPKLREIFAADFRNRMLHHILVNALEGCGSPALFMIHMPAERGMEHTVR